VAEPKTLAIVDQDFQRRRRSVAEHEDPAAEGVVLQHVFADLGQAVDSFAKIGRFDGDHDTHLRRNLHHGAGFTLPGRTHAADPAPAKAKNAEAKKPLLAFERLESNQAVFTRAKVDGGWLVMVSAMNLNAGVALTFYPDPKHEWNGGSPR
jgi:hypothetical protein